MIMFAIVIIIAIVRKHLTKKNYLSGIAQITYPVCMYDSKNTDNDNDSCNDSCIIIAIVIIVTVLRLDC